LAKVDREDTANGTVAIVCVSTKEKISSSMIWKKTKPKASNCFALCNGAGYQHWRNRLGAYSW